MHVGMHSMDTYSTTRIRIVQCCRYIDRASGAGGNNRGGTVIGMDMTI